MYNTVLSNDVTFKSQGRWYLKVNSAIHVFANQQTFANSVRNAWERMTLEVGFSLCF